MEWQHSKSLLHCKTLHEEQSGSRSSRFVKELWRKKMLYNKSSILWVILTWVQHWESLIGDESLICGEKNVYVPHAVVIIRGNVVVGHNPKNICGLYWKLSFLPNKSVRARVLGKGVSRGAVHGLEIPACFVFQGHVKWVEWIKKNDKAEKKVQACFEKCMKTAV